jgi:hypothetical protein
MYEACVVVIGHDPFPVTYTAPDCCRLMVWASQGSLHRDGRGAGAINSMV